ncbi:hypothetical protein K8O93_00785 [Gordonia bronchialis]|uniref:hypothetical protein n=1 Tax=Gordonia bronchialis TaxID=2054 RepID=UPI001CBED63A|nr:hypothetical protein [Gordonia bronchialis]UAK38369.1 hypothetical protein K8O93_00785 [Gordonia bronchialis]
MSAGQSDPVRDALRAFGQAYAAAAEGKERDGLMQAFRSNWMIIPRAEYYREIEQIGEWQARARRVINAANALINVSAPRRPVAMAVLKNALVNTEFREADGE